jgi:hypothetical protein
MRHTRSFATLLLLTLLTGACGSGPQELDTPDPGTGLIRIDAVTHTFEVLGCELTGDSDQTGSTMLGRGTTADGETFVAQVSRIEMGPVLMHSVRYEAGSVLIGGGTVLEAQRIRDDAGWRSVRDGPPEPLVRIEGALVSARGRFSEPEMRSEPVDFELRANCG